MLAANVKIEAIETEIAEMKKALKVRHDKVCMIHNVGSTCHHGCSMNAFQ